MNTKEMQSHCGKTVWFKHNFGSPDQPMVLQVQGLIINATGDNDAEWFKGFFEIFSENRQVYRVSFEDVVGQVVWEAVCKPL